jgi:hypothetical protein
VEPDTTAPAQRAAALLDELRELLPQLSVAQTGSTVDVENAIELLSASRAAAETESFQSLRAAIATAQARPRDVDVMLDLVSRADALAGVIAAHDRYVTTIDKALVVLRGDEEKDPEPKW